ncbi:hypothetical protein ASE04_28585 [Rhizobium sp. Root708]|nr:hypothetical protein ASE04_28585 [Rhizobium sp. Root708]
MSVLDRIGFPIVVEICPDSLCTTRSDPAGPIGKLDFTVVVSIPSRWTMETHVDVVCGLD